MPLLAMTLAERIILMILKALKFSPLKKEGVEKISTPSLI
jgi:hypothetical protein